ncbi:hypothetical protein MASR2M54_22210 [Aliarcobacter cryaerophilus]
MFGGQNFSDFARNQGGGVDLDEILRQMLVVVLLGLDEVILVADLDLMLQI